MSVRIESISPTYPSVITIQWQLLDEDPAAVDGVTFDIQRSGSASGPWQVRGTGLSGIVFSDRFQDNEADTYEENLLSLRREVWYRVVAHLRNGEVLTSEPVDDSGNVPTKMVQRSGVGLMPVENQSMPGRETVFQNTPATERRLVLIQRAVQRRAGIALKMFSGVACAILKRRHFGHRCRACVDPVTKAIVRSRCVNCYGTGWDGGYHTPIRTLLRVQEAPVNTVTEPASKAEIISATVELLDFPRLERGDIVVELDKDRRWLVVAPSDSYLRRRRVTQRVQCTLLGRSSVEYGVPVEPMVDDYVYT